MEDRIEAGISPGIPTAGDGAAAPPAASNPSRPPQPGRTWLLALAVRTAPERERMPRDWDPARMPKPMYHRIAAIGMLRARIHQAPGGGERLEVVECRAGGKADAGEADLLMGFWQAFDRWRPRLVTFNGRGFMMQALQYRSMLHGISAPAFQAGEGRNVWTSRYAPWLHADLMDLLSDYGAGERPSLADLSRGLSIPAWEDDGPDTEALLDEGMLDEVRATAEANSVTVFLAYLRWRLFTGGMSAGAHDEARDALRAMLAARQPNSTRPIAGLLSAWPGTPAPSPVDG